jgi:peptide/nickel transport system substrate-binding protein
LKRSIFYFPDVLSRTEVLTLVALFVVALFAFLGTISNATKNISDPIPDIGGSLHEGIVGNPRFINPLLEQTDADRDIVTLIYNGLMRHDGQGNLVPSLAESYEISENGMDYTFTLRENLFWPDGKSITADDVVFTIHLAQNPQIQSPKRANWEGVDVEKIDTHTIRFRLRRAYIPFLENLTLGILPKHKWENIPLSQFALVALNTDEPMGAGPYHVTSVKRNSVGSITSMKLKSNKQFALGSPYIKKLAITFFPSEEIALEALKRQSIDTLGGISPKNIPKINDKISTINALQLRRIIAVFFNKDLQPTLASKNVRNALTLGTDKDTLVSSVLKNYGEAINSPFPIQSLATSTKSSEFNIEAAKSLIDKEKGPVAFTLTTAKTPELEETANILKDMWKNIGVDIEINTFPVDDLTQFVIGPRKYDAFLYGEEIIGKNPDLFAFWHSSQREHPGYNIALYANSKIDNLLENVRAEQNDEKRLIQYTEIGDEITKDLPAIFLYSPQYIYITTNELKGLNTPHINTGSERFSAIHLWHLKERYVWKWFK